MRAIFILFFFSITLNCSIALAEQIRVGVVLPLSGGVAKMGVAVKNGILLYQEREADSAAKINFIFEDGKYDGKDTINAVNKLINVDKVKALLIWGNTPSNVAAPITDKLHVPTFMVSHATNSVTHKNIVELGPDEWSCISLAAKAVKKANPKTFGAVTIDIGNAVKFFDDMDREVGQKLFREYVSTENFQFQPILLKGKSAGITSYFAFLMAEQTMAFAKQANELHLDLTLYSGDIIAEEPVLRDLIRINSNVKLMYGITKPWFVKAYQKRFGDSSFLLEAGSGYSFGQLISKLGDAGRLNPKTFQDDMKRLDLSELAYNSPSFSSKGARVSTECKIISAQDYLDNGAAKTSNYRAQKN